MASTLFLHRGHVMGRLLQVCCKLRVTVGDVRGSAIEFG